MYLFGNIVLLNYLVVLRSSDINWVLCCVITLMEIWFKGSPCLSTEDSDAPKPACVPLFTGALCCSGCFPESLSEVMRQVNSHE